MRNIFIFTIFLFTIFAAEAKQTMVSNASEISGTLWYPGDTIVMSNGIWTNQAIYFRAEGSEDLPIVLMAETPGEVILNGSSKLSFSGKYLIVDGLYFKDGTLSGSAVVEFRTSSSSLAENCRLTNTVIKNYNPPLNTTDSKWVSLYGKNNMVDHCSFENKNNSGTLLVVWLTSGTTPNHIIDSNYFGYRIANLDSNGNELNGQEIIRIGDSSTSMQTAGVVVSNNIFEHCDGEIEIISNKSCENIYTNNLFYECKGMLTLRHGNRCTVEGNYFIGNKIKDTGGVRIIGEDHKVYNNYFENLTGSGYRAGLCIVRGKENSALNEYFQVKNANVMFNTFVDCEQSFAINYNSSSSLNMPPIGTRIDHNHVYNTSSHQNVIVYNVNIEAMDVSWKNNLMNQGMYTNLTYSPTEIIVGIDPSMTQAGTSTEIYEPASTSLLADYTTDEYPEISMDIRGRDRGNTKTPGASQLMGTTSLEMPTIESVGASFFPSTETKVKAVKVSTDFFAYAVNKQIYTKVSMPGTLAVYDITGRFIVQKRLETGLNSLSLSKNGFFLLKYKTNTGIVSSQKIANF
ncbi:MAG: polysaccharide lyase 6 family protein [Bacteroidales bacterium]|nr:polysaccharide lyase 6 family protein [Bacteroidales bacterium]